MKYFVIVIFDFLDHEVANNFSIAYIESLLLALYV